MPDALRTSGRLSAAVLLSRVLGLAREVLFATLFGARELADAYQVAFRIPNLLRDLFAEGALSSALVPTLTDRVVNRGPADAHALGNLIMAAVLVITGGLTALGVIFAEELVVAISAGFAGNASKVALAARLTRIMMPILSLVSLSAVWMGVLNAQRRFMAPALAPAAFNVVSLVAGGAIWLAGAPAADGVVLWSFGTLAAGVVQAAIQLPALWRIGYRPWPRIRGLWSDPGVRRVGRLMLPAVVGLAAVQLNIFINTRFAGSLGDGAVAQLNYAFRLFYLPIGMFGVALATVTTTGVSEDAARGDMPALARRASDSVSAAWMLTSASAVGLWVLAEPVVALIFRHGATTSADATAIAWVLRAYLLGLVPYSLVKILAPSFYTIDRPRIPLVASAAAVAANVTFNALTYRILGAPGIALGTAIGAFVNLTILRVSFARRIGPLRRERRLREAAALILANAAMGGGVFGLWWLTRPYVASMGTLGAAAVVAGGVGIGFVIFTGIMRAFGYPGAAMLWGLPGKLGRRLWPRRTE